MRDRRSLGTLLLLVWAGLFSLASHSVGLSQTPLGTAFTYQGRLDSAGSPASGSFDFVFTLFDAETAGATIGSPVSKDDVAVANGLFTVDLDFGAAAFGGDSRWLEIGVRPGASTGTFSTLTPRTRLQPTPFAIHAEDARTVGGAEGSTLLAGIRSFTVATGQSVKKADAVSFAPGGATIRPGFGVSLEEFGPRLDVSTPAAIWQIKALEASRFAVLVPSPISPSPAVLEFGQISFGAIEVDLALPVVPLFIPVGGALPFVAPSAAIAVTSPTKVFFIEAETQLISPIPIPGIYQPFLRASVIEFNGTSLVGISNPATFPGPALSSPTFFQSLAAVALSPTQVVVAYSTGATGELQLYDVTANPPAITATATFNSGATDSISIAALSSSTFIVGYRDTGNVTIGTCIAGVAGANSLTLGPEVPFNAAATDSVSVAALTDTKFVIGYRDEGAANNPGTAIIGTLASGSDTPTFGAEAIINSGSTDIVSISRISANQFFAAFRDTGGSGSGTVRVADVSGTSMNFGPALVVSNGATSKISAAPLTASSFLVGFENDSGTAAASLLDVQLSTSPIIGVARTAGTEGQQVPVSLFVNRGISNVHTGLVPGASYFAQLDGGITTDVFGVQMGVAISPTELMFIP